MLVRMLATIAALAIPPVTPFEFGTIAEVFGIDRTAEGVPPLELRVCGPRAGEPVATTIGCEFVPAYGLEGLRGADLLAGQPEHSAAHHREADHTCGLGVQPFSTGIGSDDFGGDQ